MADKEISKDYIDITFSRELSLNGVMTNTVRMREPTVGDQIAAMALKGSEAEKEVALVANLCMLSPKDVTSMPLREFIKLKAGLESFID